MYGVIITALISAALWLLPKLLAVGGTIAFSMTVITPIISYFQAQVMQRINGAPVDMLNFLVFCGIPEAISIVFAAITMRWAMKAATLAFAKAGAR